MALHALRRDHERDTHAWQQQCEALAWGLHPRLGSASPVGCVSEYVLGDILRLARPRAEPQLLRDLHRQRRGAQLDRLWSLTAGRRTDRRIPRGVSMNQWIADNTIALYDMTVLSYSLTSEFCTQKTCPIMSAGPDVEYRWTEGGGRSERVSAPEYAQLVLGWAYAQLSGDEYARGASRLLVTRSRRILSRLARVFAHVWHSHMADAEAAGLDRAVLRAFERFHAFTSEFCLVDDADLVPLRGLIAKRVSELEAQLRQARVLLEREVTSSREELLEFIRASDVLRKRAADEHRQHVDKAHAQAAAAREEASRELLERQAADQRHAEELKARDEHAADLEARLRLCESRAAALEQQLRDRSDQNLRRAEAAEARAAALESEQRQPSGTPAVGAGRVEELEETVRNLTTELTAMRRLHVRSKGEALLAQSSTAVRTMLEAAAEGPDDGRVAASQRLIGELQEQVRTSAAVAEDLEAQLDEAARERDALRHRVEEQEEEAAATVQDLRRRTAMLEERVAIVRSNADTEARLFAERQKKLEGAVASLEGELQARDSLWRNKLGSERAMFAKRVAELRGAQCEEADAEAAAAPQKQPKQQQGAATTGSVVCAVCKGPLGHEVVQGCGHAVCEVCAEQRARGGCPACGEQGSTAGSGSEHRGAEGSGDGGEEGPVQRGPRRLKIGDLWSTQERRAFERGLPGGGKARERYCEAAGLTFGVLMKQPQALLHRAARNLGMQHCSMSTSCLRFHLKRFIEGRDAPEDTPRAK
eukprot:m51a1_g14399 hypothetical protein (763) ;mRNA; r:355713-358545